MTAWSFPAAAQTFEKVLALEQALAHAYRTNPELNAARARLRSTDENYAQAMSGYQPTVSANAEYGRSQLTSRPRSDDDGSNNPGGYSVTVSQPLFRGFRTVSALRRARAEINAAREGLRQTEQSVLLFAVASYLDVVRDLRILRLRADNVRILDRELAGVRRRLQASDATRTDEAQTIARRAAAVSELRAARANLATARAYFERTFGFPAGKLRQPPALFALLPQTIDEALEIADSENPNVIAATFRRVAAKFATREARGRLLPEVNLQASYQDQFSSVRTQDRSQEASVIGRVTIPIYQAGTVRSDIRRSLHNETGARLDAEQARRVARADLIAAWSRLRATVAQIESDKVSIRASVTALDGVKRERLAGQRTMIEVLNAQTALLEARIRLTTTQREHVLGAYRVIAAIGRLTAEDLNLSAAVHDKAANFRIIADPWNTIVTRH